MFTDGEEEVVDGQSDMAVVSGKGQSESFGKGDVGWGGLQGREDGSYLWRVCWEQGLTKECLVEG